VRELDETNFMATSALAELPSKILLDHLHSPAFLLDAEWQIHYANPAAQQVFGLSPDPRPPLALEQLLDHPDQDLKHVKGLESDRGRYAWIRNERHYQPQVSSYALSDDSVGYLLLLMDVTHFKKQTENMTTFLQTVSHDLRSPLTAAKGFVDMMSMVGDLNERQQAMREKILISIVDMTNLVEKVLDAGRLDSEMGTYLLRRETCDPSAIAEKVVSNLTGAAQKKAISLSLEVSPAVPPMNIDEMMLERALMNLVENAIKYSPDGGVVEVRLYVENNRLYFSIADNGLGIPADKQATIFEKGIRIRRAEHRTIRGSGLGLFIVKSVAQQHEGDVFLKSVEGQGSEFLLMIPIAGLNVVGAGS
jgi:two-component system phosphate regulon sensor histidine kinase PhoR